LRPQASRSLAASETPARGVNAADLLLLAVPPPPPVSLLVIVSIRLPLLASSPACFAYPFWAGQLPIGSNKANQEPGELWFGGSSAGMSGRA